MRSVALGAVAGLAVLWLGLAVADWTGALDWWASRRCAATCAEDGYTTSAPASSMIRLPMVGWTSMRIDQLNPSCVCGGPDGQWRWRAAPSRGLLRR